MNIYSCLQRLLVTPRAKATRQPLRRICTVEVVQNDSPLRLCVFGMYNTVLPGRVRAYIILYIQYIVLRMYTHALCAQLDFIPPLSNRALGGVLILRRLRSVGARCIPFSWSGDSS